MFAPGGANSPPARRKPGDTISLGGLRPSKPLTAGAGGRPGGGRCRVEHAAFLAAEGRVETLARGVHGAGPHPWRAACTGQPRTHGASGRARDAPAAAGAGARGGAVAAPPPWRAYPTIYRPKHATPYRITTRRIYPRIYHATHRQKPHAACPKPRFLWRKDRSKRSRAAVRSTPAPMARAAGAVTRLPRQKRARAAGPWQPRTHGGPIPTIYRPKHATPRHTASQRAAYILGLYHATHRRNRRRMRQAAFLASSGHSQRSRATVRGTPAPMARAAGAGTRLPRRKRAHAAGPWQPRTHDGPIPRIPSQTRHAIPHHNAPHIS